MDSQPGNDVGSHLAAVGLVQDLVARGPVQRDGHIGQTGIAVALPQKLDQRTAARERVGVAGGDRCKPPSRRNW